MILEQTISLAVLLSQLFKYRTVPVIIVLIRFSLHNRNMSGQNEYKEPLSLSMTMPMDDRNASSENAATATPEEAR